jgi:hypothetical protein
MEKKLYSQEIYIKEKIYFKVNLFNKYFFSSVFNFNLFILLSG